MGGLQPRPACSLQWRSMRASQTCFVNFECGLAARGECEAGRVKCADFCASVAEAPPVSPSALRADVRSRDAYAAESRPRSSNVHYPRGPIHLPVNPPHHSRLRGAECGSLCTFGHLSQESKNTWPHPDPDRERPSASLVYEERDPEYENYGCWNEWGCTCFAPVLQATSVTRDTKSETEEE